MPTAEVITPATITKDLPADQDPEAPYSWAKQARTENVSRESVRKQAAGLSSRRAPKAATPGASPAVSPATPEKL
jgi:hypothetical protein